MMNYAFLRVYGKVTFAGFTRIQAISLIIASRIIAIVQIDGLFSKQNFECVRFPRFVLL